MNKEKAGRPRPAAGEELCVIDSELISANTYRVTTQSGGGERVIRKVIFFPDLDPESEAPCARAAH